MSHSFECHHCGKIHHDRFSPCSCGLDFRYFRHHRYDDFHRKHDCHSLCDCHKRFHHRDRQCFNHHFRHKDDCDCLKRRRRIYDDRFDGKLRGLDGELAFRLRQLIGCVVKFKVECGNECREFKGTVCHVGKDFVEIEKLHHDDHDHTRRKRDCKCKDRRRHKCKCKCKDHKSKFLIIPLDEIKIIKIVDDKKGHC